MGTEPPANLPALPAPPGSPGRAGDERSPEARWEAWEEALSAFLDGELGAREREQVCSALETTPQLAARLAELRAVDHALRQLPARPLPTDLRARLERLLEADRAASAEGRPRRGPAPLRPRTPRRARLWPAAALAAAAATLAVLLLPRLLPPPPRAVPVARTGPEAAGTGADLRMAKRDGPDELADVGEDLPVIAVLDVLEDLGDLDTMGTTGSG